MYIVNMASGCTHKESSFVSLDYLDNISNLLDEDNDLEEEITHLFTEAKYFYFQCWKKPPINQALNMLKTCNA